MRVVHKLIVVLVLVVIASAVTGRAGREKDIPVSELPKVVLEAAKRAVPGIEIDEAEVEKTAKGLVYEVEGEVGGKEYELLISAEGKVLGKESDDDDDDDDGEKDDKDDDDDDGK
jgi:hypothetical protein